jgi:hypothetical protein
MGCGCAGVWETKVQAGGRCCLGKRPRTTSQGMWMRGNNPPGNKRGAVRGRILVLPTAKPSNNKKTTISHKRTNKLVSAAEIASIAVDFVGAQWTEEDGTTGSGMATRTAGQCGH